MKDVWKAVATAEVFAICVILVWELWMKQFWVSMDLPRLHHYWYGIFLVFGALVLHILMVDRRVQAFMYTTGLIWFGTDFPDVIDHLGLIIAIILVVLVILILVVIAREYQERRSNKQNNLKRKMGKK